MTDFEAAIINAIESTTNLLLVGCHRHLRNDIKHWVEQHGGGMAEKLMYVDDLMELLMTNKYSQYTAMYTQKQSSWSEDFKAYFDTRVRSRLDKYAKWAIGKKCPSDLEQGITNNISEGYNYLLKNLQSWWEIPFDSLILGLRMLQSYYLNEIQT